MFKVTNCELRESQMITKQLISQQLTKYLNHQMLLPELVDWAESTIMEGNIEPDDTKITMQILGRLAAADVKEFGLLWEDCEEIMRSLGYDIKVKTILAA